MKIFIAAIFAMLMLPQIGLSQTLCHKDEVDYFSCQVAGSKKIISVCGNIIMGEINEDSWLQYRFGTKGALELVYPIEKRLSTSKFQGHYFGRYAAADLRFINGKVLYVVYLNGGSSGSEEQEDVQASAGVSVELGKDKRANIRCQHGDTGEHYSRFMELSAWLTAPEGTRDFSDRFYGSLPK